MRLEDLLTNFFELEKESIPYATVSEYEMDQVRWLDMILNIACSMKYLVSEDSPVEIENAHLRGVPITGAEVTDSLMMNMISYENEIENEIAYDRIQTIITEARLHIEKRVAITKLDIPLRRLVKQIDLSSFEQFVFLLAYANFMDTKYELIYAFLQGDVRMKLPSLRLAVSLYELFDTVNQVELAGLAEGQGTLFDIILKSEEVYDNIKLARTYTLHDSVYGWLQGKQKISREIEKFAQLFRSGNAEDSIEEVKLRHNDIKKVNNLMGEMLVSNEHGNVLNIYGDKGMGKRFFIRQAGKEQNRAVLFVSISAILSGQLKPEELRERCILLYRECILRDAILCFTPKNQQIKEEEMDQLYEFIHYLKQYISFFVWLSEEKAEYFMVEGFRYVGYEVFNLTMKERFLLWKEYGDKYPLDQQFDFNLLSSQYVLSIKEIQDALWNADLHRKSEGRQVISLQDIRNAIKQQSVTNLGSCASLIPSTYTWNDLVLSDENVRQLKLIINQVKYKSIVGEEWGFFGKTAYGRGTCALFYGAPGTGKTMAVQVLASELGLNLYRIDLSQLVSKYIGETEKNISKVFERAKGINALLFFDEADSLFAKRTEVHDSLDRSANAQTAHLLQQIENYDGITILATNLAMNIDDAFKRRFKFMVKFSFPSEVERLKLWKTILPVNAPCEENLELEFFAKKFELSGSSIKEILTNAAFLAAAEQRKLSNEDIIEAIKLNFMKYGKTLSQDEFEYLV